MNPRIAAWFLCIALLFAAATDYIPAFIDADGRVFGLFKLDIYKDALHVASGVWAAVAALWYLLVLRQIRFYGMATCHRQGWITRKKVEVTLSGPPVPPAEVLVNE